MAVPQQQAAQVTTNVIVQSRPSQALPALANFFIIGLGQLIQGRLWTAFCFFFLSVVSGLLCLVGIGFVLLPIVWLWAILDAAKYVPPTR